MAAKKAAALTTRPAAATKKPRAPRTKKTAPPPVDQTTVQTAVLTVGPMPSGLGQKVPTEQKVADRHAASVPLPFPVSQPPAAVTLPPPPPPPVTVTVATAPPLSTPVLVPAAEFETFREGSARPLPFPITLTGPVPWLGLGIVVAIIAIAVAAIWPATLPAFITVAVVAVLTGPYLLGGAGPIAKIAVVVMLTILVGSLAFGLIWVWGITSTLLVGWLVADRLL